jgi:hypothetical protein
MKRVTSVLIAVLLGAMATGVGIVPFLVLANQDRNRMASELEQAHKRAESAESEKNKIAKEANERVEEANAEVQRAEIVLQDIAEDQRLAAEAVRLSKPPPRDLYRWSSYISLYQEVNLFLPPDSSVSSDTKVSLTIVNEKKNNAFEDARWLAITPYDPELERDLFASFGTSAGVSYIAGDRLLTGKRGTLKDGSEAMVLKARHAATSTHLIWIKDPGTLGRDGFERILGTMEFNS